MAMVVTLLAVGVILIGLETVLPGLIAGIMGCLALVAGIVISYSQFGLRTGNLVLAGVLVAAVAGWMVYLKYFPNSPLAQRLISHKTVGDVGAEQPQLLHQTGTALTPLRPSGTAVIDGRRVDVVSEGGLIERGAPVKVIAVEGLRVVVRAV